MEFHRSNSWHLIETVRSMFEADADFHWKITDMTKDLERQKDLLLLI